MNSAHDASLVYRSRPAQGTPRGLLVLLHGVGANETSLAALADEQSPDVHVVLARGPVNLGPSAYGWYQVSFGPRGPVFEVAQAESSRESLVRFIESQQQEAGIPPSRTIVAGFSQGGIMSAGIALTAPARVRAFGILSGRILPEFDALVPADIATYPLDGLVMHGRADNMLPFTLAETSASHLAALGVRHAVKAYDGVGHGMSDSMRNDFRRWVDEQLGLPAA